MIRYTSSRSRCAIPFWTSERSQGGTSTAQRSCGSISGSLHQPTKRSFHYAGRYRGTSLCPVKEKLLTGLSSCDVCQNRKRSTHEFIARGSCPPIWKESENCLPVFMLARRQKR